MSITIILFLWHLKQTEYELLLFSFSWLFFLITWWNATSTVKPHFLSKTLTAKSIHYLKLMAKLIKM